jgi:formylglycine-generating enzyme required for sulfatase activity
MEPSPVRGCTEDATRVCIAAGVSQLGRAAAEARFEERPARGARLRAFAIDRNEVAAAAYARCVATGGCREPRCDDARDVPTSGPAACVAWQDARTYCERAEGRLPTEAEWERVAAGLLPEHRVFPWGDDAGAAPDGAAMAMDQTPDGVMGLGGGVAEWVQDVGAFYLLPVHADAGADAHADSGDARDASGANAPPSSAETAETEFADASLPEQTDAGMPIVDEPRGPRDGPWRVVRGGNLGVPIVEWTTTRRRFRQPGDRRSWIGFRCAYDVHGTDANPAAPASARDD